MRPILCAKEHPGLLISLTNCGVIAAEVQWLQSQGYTKLAIWRHFLEHFVVDLDALSLIIGEMFGPSAGDAEPRPAADAREFEYREAA
ncbi:MAG: hypothetical protein ACHQAQ_12325 [Hyphomicrobiales bacterium]